MHSAHARRSESNNWEPLLLLTIQCWEDKEGVQYTTNKLFYAFRLFVR